MTDTKILPLPAPLAEQLGAEKLLVEVTPLTGSAILAGAWRTWHEEDGVLVGDEEVRPDEAQRAALEELFAASMPAPEPTGPRPKSAGKVRHTENRSGRFSYRKSKRV